MSHNLAADVVTNATATATASAMPGHAENQSRFQHGSAAGRSPPAASPPGLGADMSTPSRTHDPGRSRRAKTESPSRERTSSRSSEGRRPARTPRCQTRLRGHLPGEGRVRAEVRGELGHGLGREDAGGEIGVRKKNTTTYTYYPYIMAQF